MLPVSGKQSFVSGINLPPSQSPARLPTTEKGKDPFRSSPSPSPSSAKYMKPTGATASPTAVPLITTSHTMHSPGTKLISQQPIIGGSGVVLRRRTSSGGLPLVVNSLGRVTPLFSSAFAEIGDGQRLGFLPSEDDLFFKLWESVGEDFPQPIVGWAGPSLSATVNATNMVFPTATTMPIEKANNITDNTVWVPVPAANTNTITTNNNNNNTMAIVIPSSFYTHHIPSMHPMHTEQNARVLHKRSAEDESPASPKKSRRTWTGGTATSTPQKMNQTVNNTVKDDDEEYVHESHDDTGHGSGDGGKTYRGVSRHRMTQRWEASLWLNGRQLYLGGFDTQEDAAHAYDLAALACKGPNATVNFSPVTYAGQLQEVAGFSRDEVVAYVRRRSAAFSRGRSRYRGVSGQNGKWEARIGTFNGRKNVSFGVFDSEEAAARQYDRALILEKGRSAKTNFPLRDYEAEVAEYREHMARVCGGLPRGSSTDAVKAAEAYTLPRNRLATADERKRSAVIYGEQLRQALFA